MTIAVKRKGYPDVHYEDMLPISSCRVGIDGYYSIEGATIDVQPALLLWDSEELPDLICIATQSHITVIVGDEDD